jgi:hypothetical protein
VVLGVLQLRQVLPRGAQEQVVAELHRPTQGRGQHSRDGGNSRKYQHTHTHARTGVAWVLGVARRTSLAQNGRVRGGVGKESVECYFHTLPARNRVGGVQAEQGDHGAA